MSLRFRSRICFLVLFFTAQILMGQSRNDLEKKREDLNRRIRETNSLLQKTRKSTQQVKSQLNLLNSQIKLRQELISTINSEISGLDMVINERQTHIQKKNSELQQLRSEYTRMLQNAQLRSNHYNQMLYIFAASDFHQAFKRMRYLQQYSASRMRQARLIEHTQFELGIELRTLSDKKLEKTSLLSAKEQEKLKLDKDKSSQVKVISKLQQEEKGLRAKLAKAQQEKKKIDREIAKVLAAEIKKAKSANKGTFKLAPAAKIVSDNFAANKGNLPWPVDKGTITGRFGRQTHPFLRNITIDNSGIDITTTKEARVKAIFKGTVSSILVIPGAGKVVVLDHGAYRSVYTKLKEVTVEKGQSVSAGDVLGICLPSEEGAQSEAHLEIWQIGQEGTTRLNPSSWLKR